MTSRPTVTVAMPVYNGAATLQRAIDSVLAQTYRDFELLIIDDGSSDDSLERISRNGDSRIRLLAQETNRGLAETRNHLAKESRGEYIAWLDCDDWAHPERLAIQVSKMTTDPNLVLCGTWTRAEGETRMASAAVRRLSQRSYSDDAHLRASQLFANAIATSSVMMKAESLRTIGPVFRESYAPAEDFDLWARLIEHGSMHCIQRFLTTRQELATGASQTRRVEQAEASLQVKLNLLKRLGLSLSSSEMARFAQLTRGYTKSVTTSDAKECMAIIDKILSANEARGTYDQMALRRVSGGALMQFFAPALRHGDKGALRILRDPAFVRLTCAWFPYRALASIRRK